MDNKYSKLFTPIKIGNLTLKNRIFASPTSLNWLAVDGNLTPETIAFYEMKAMGGAAVVTLGEVIPHSATGKSHDRQLCLDNPNCLVSLSQLARAIKRHGAVPNVEISHGGKWGGLESLAGSQKEGKIAYGPIHEILPEGEVHEMPKELIEEVCESFGKGAAVVQRAGFEMCMVHAGHGWFFGHFLAKRSNTRTDEFGGSLENRARPLLLALDSIRKHCGPNFPIEVRISGDEFVEGGITIEEATQLAILIQDKCDLINVSAGIHENLELFIRTHPSQYIEKAANVHLAAEIRKHVHVPISTVGAITDPELMEEILESGKADVIKLGRPLLADPFLPEKLRTGREKEISHCLRCNSCFGESVKTGMISCVVNPIIGNERNEWLAKAQPTTPKKVMVIGGGPGGMEAALTAHSRGHKVVLYEQKEKLGGALAFAEFVDFKHGLFELAETLQYRLSMTDVEIHTGAGVTEETVKAEAPDVLLIATGALPIVPRIPGIDGENVKLASTVFGKEDTVGETVAVLGGGLVGCETATHLARMGKKVTIVEMREDVAIDCDCFGQTAIKVDMRKNNVCLKTGFSGKAITGEGILVADKDGNETLIAADTVINEVGYRPNEEMFLKLANSAPIVQRIGDCRRTGKVTNAMADGHYLAMDI